ncbi:protein-serine/threonine phosphatase [Bacteroidia bacterium]|nr:protein-serine/threonine phosphatase [Bacteroidia bacterium]GHU09820.1 protein-serine/threonine phosphatase [Alphaproteobacteria bacterium]GHU55660.1 protein-serine/threonine phosphatase [Bacteroidia bacterium]GHU82685.1 protein-serine/threonine phosphatase [Bacteroidia bacterium]
MNPVQFKLSAKTNIGCVRTNNEDNFIVNPDLSDDLWILPQSQDTIYTLGRKGALLVVADGMGGLDAGEIASQIAIDTLKEYFSSDKITDEIVKDESSIRKYLREVIIASDVNIKKRCKEEQNIKTMGTTIVVSWLLNGYAYISWCGDSRLYHFNSLSGLVQLTTDHSYVQELVDAGKLSPELAFDHPDSNIITRSLGNPAKAADPDFMRIELQNNSFLLLCTDGLNSMLQDFEIDAIMQQNTEQIGECVDALIMEALEKGGHDNVTIVLSKLIGEDEPEEEDGESMTTIYEKHKRGKISKIVLSVLFIIMLLALIYWLFFK